MLLISGKFSKQKAGSLISVALECVPDETFVVSLQGTGSVFCQFIFLFRVFAGRYWYDLKLQQFLISCWFSVSEEEEDESLNIDADL